MLDQMLVLIDELRQDSFCDSEKTISTGVFLFAVEEGDRCF